MRRLDYLSGLGVTCVWLQPFFTSPNRDNGYDVTDYDNIHEKHGSLGVSGFRMDAVPFLIEKKGAGVEREQDFNLLKEMRDFTRFAPRETEMRISGASHGID